MDLKVLFTTQLQPHASSALGGLELGARLRRQHSVLRRVLRRVLGRVLGKGSQKRSEKGACCGLSLSKKGFSEGVLRRAFPEGA